MINLILLTRIERTKGRFTHFLWSLECKRRKEHSNLFIFFSKYINVGAFSLKIVEFRTNWYFLDFLLSRCERTKYAIIEERRYCLYQTITVTSLNEKLMHQNDTDKKLQNLDDVCFWQKRDSNSCNEIKILS